MDNIILKLSELTGMIPDFALDAIKDSINLIPWLFIIFVFIEIFENYFSKKIHLILKYSQKVGPLIGTCLAIIPQCGFSIVAAMLYVKKFISTGTLLAVFVATSDEAIPILMAYPEQIHIVGKVVLIKLILAIIIGYSTDFILKEHNKTDLKENEISIEKTHGCCSHSLKMNNIKELFIHPLKHTFWIFLFILAVCLVLNYMFETLGLENISKIMLNNTVFQPVLVGIFGLIPNCAVSVLITMMYIKGAISFGSVVSGLSSGAGLGLLVLYKKNSSLKNSIFVTLVLLVFSIFSGILFQIFTN